MTKYSIKKPFTVLVGVIMVLVLGVVVIAAYRDGTGFDVLRRYFSYGRAEQNAEAGYDYLQILLHYYQNAECVTI